MMQEMIKKVILIIDDRVEKKTFNVISDNNLFLNNKMKTHKHDVNNTILELKGLFTKYEK